MSHENEPHDILLPLTEVCKILARSKASIYRDIKAGRFPAPQKLGGSSRWRRSIIMQVVDGNYRV